MRLDWIHPYPDVEPRRPEFLDFYRKLEGFLRREVDPDAIDAAGDTWLQGSALPEAARPAPRPPAVEEPVEGKSPVGERGDESMIIQ